ncbi:fungal-specific transcription factor domain-containing protein [Aspergillus cavernicola]|uniref:Fungal-specific transcription factor domain-containing protein n=1 Tax=Aspergillus cavernicola TaxID=176166 RepID=A0ABR4HZA5_9EURO
MEQNNPTRSPQPAKRTRSRTGCWTCREAGYKCDELKPNCGRCIRLGIHCKGYASRLKWRSHNAAERRARCKSTSTENDIGSSQGDSPLSTSPHSGLSLSEYPSLSIRPSDMTLEQYRLLHHWIVYTSPLLCVSPIYQTNSFQMHLTPMVLHSDSPLRHAVLSVAASHLTASDPSQNLALTAQTHRVSAITALREGLNNNIIAYSDITLASILVLEISKQFDNSPRHDVNHLIGAKELILGRGGPQSLTTPCSRFLLTQVLYHDLLSAVSMGSSPLISHHWLKQENPLESSRGYHSTILQAVACISELKARKEALAEAAYNQENALAEFMAAGREIEKELDSMVVSATEPDQAQTTKAHRSAALIYLYRVVYDIGAPHPLTVSLVRRCIDAIASIHPSSPLISAHVWPLFTAGCEATEPQDREFVNQRLVDMYQQRKIGSLRKVRELMEQVWLSKDFRNTIAGAEQMCRVGCIEVVKSLGEILQLV